MRGPAAARALAGIAALLVAALAGPAAAQPPAPEPARLTLDQALEESRRAHETGAISRARVEQAVARRREALGALLPRATADASATLRDRQVRFGDNLVQRQLEWGAAVGVALPLLDLPALERKREAEELAEVTRTQAAWDATVLALETELAFHALEAAAARLEVTEASLAHRRAWEEQVAQLARAGLATPLDARRATAQRLQGERAVLAAQAAVGDASDALALLLGREPGETLSAEAGPLPAPPAPAAVPSLDARPDLRAAALGVEALDRQERAAWRELVPTLELRTDLRLAPTSFSRPEVASWSAVLALRWDLYDGGARYARVDETRAAVREGWLALQRDHREARVEASRALRDWAAAAADAALADGEREVALGTRAIVEERFARGLAQSFEVSDAVDAAWRAEVDAVAARLGVRLAEARWRWLTRVAPAQ